MNKRTFNTLSGATLLPCDQLFRLRTSEQNLFICSVAFKTCGHCKPGLLTGGIIFQCRQMHESALHRTPFFSCAISVKKCYELFTFECEIHSSSHNILDARAVNL